MKAAKSFPTKYRNVNFRSRLEARWAAFFDIIGWKWKYEPIDFPDWVPDFYVEFPCGHNDCPPNHKFYAEVKPYYHIKEFDGHPATKNSFGDVYGLDGSILLGINPSVVKAEFAHGAGGGVFSGYELFNWYRNIFDIEYLWSEAGNKVQWGA